MELTSMFFLQDSNIYHGIGTIPEWKKLTRDLIVDLQKGLNYASKDKSKHKIPRSKLKVVNIMLRWVFVILQI